MPVKGRVRMLVVQVVLERMRGVLTHPPNVVTRQMTSETPQRLEFCKW
jgi:hypothetical protein